MRLALVLAIAACGFEPARVEPGVAGPDGSADGESGVDAPPGDASDGSASSADGAAADARPPDARGNGIHCLTTDLTCGGDQVCCVSSSGCTYSAACAAPGGCSTTGMICDGPEDCPAGSMCCGFFTGSNFDTRCDSTCGADYVLCHGSEDCGGGTCCFNCGTDVGLCDAGC